MENDRKARVILDSYCTQVVTNSRDKVTNKKKESNHFINAIQFLCRQLLEINFSV